MAATVERRRLRLTKEPAFRGRSGHEAGDAGISTPPGAHMVPHQHEAGYIRADGTRASQPHPCRSGADHTFV